CFIVPSDNVYAPNKLRSNTDSQIGTGPYKLVKYTPGQQAVFERNNDYWGPKSKTEGLIIRYYSKSSTMKLAIQRGEIDMSFQTFTPTELTSLQKASGVRVYTGPGSVIRYLTFNVTREPTSNIAVRKAVAYLMPRQAIATRVYHNSVKPLYSMPPAGLPAHIDAFASLYRRAPPASTAGRRVRRGRRRSCRRRASRPRSRSRSGGRRATTATRRPTSTPRSSAASSGTASSRSR